jgi:hypothetical protein
MPKLDFNWNATAPAPLIFRIIAFFLSILAFFMGTLALIDTFSSSPVKFDATFKHGISYLLFGILSLVFTIRGRIYDFDIRFKSTKEIANNKKIEDKYPIYTKAGLDNYIHELKKETKEGKWR